MKRVREGLLAMSACVLVLGTLVPGAARAGASALGGAEAAAAQVRRATEGRVLGVRRVQRERQPAYAVRVLLPDGRVTTRFVDAAAADAAARRSSPAGDGAGGAGTATGR